MMVHANIPFNKVEKKHLKEFLENFESQQYGKTCLPACYDDTLNNLCAAVGGDGKIWISMNKTEVVCVILIPNLIMCILSPYRAAITRSRMKVENILKKMLAMQLCAIFLISDMYQYRHVI